MNVIHNFILDYCMIPWLVKGVFIKQWEEISNRLLIIYSISHSLLLCDIMPTQV